VAGAHQVAANVLAIAREITEALLLDRGHETRKRSPPR
jgi:hypothetical protein